jgi:hypothetical protein
MARILLSCTTAICNIGFVSHLQAQFAGRWDMTVTNGDDKYPSWMEVEEEGGTPKVRVQGRTGNVRPVVAAKIEQGTLYITVAAATATAQALSWELKADKKSGLSGTQKRGDAFDGKLAGVRAPKLDRAAPKAWTEPQALFNGKDLSGWQPIHNTPTTFKPVRLPNFWAAKNGELVNGGKGANLSTIRKFDDFKLHLEFNSPPGENSGVYLRGRYEAQVTSTPGGGNPSLGLGGIYGYLAPASPVQAVAVGQWQTYDITLIGRRVTVVLNGVTTIDNQEIPGITGGALDSNEGEPGPIYFQGDHHGGIRYRNITISVPKR